MWMIALFTDVPEELALTLFSLLICSALGATDVPMRSKTVLLVARSMWKTKFARFGIPRAQRTSISNIS